MSIQSGERVLTTVTALSEASPTYGTDFVVVEVKRSGRGGEITLLHIHEDTTLNGATEVEIKLIDGNYVLWDDGTGLMRMYAGGTTQAQIEEGTATEVAFDDVPDSQCAYYEDGITVSGASATTADHQVNFMDNVTGVGPVNYSCRNKTPNADARNLRGTAIRPTRLICAVKLVAGSGQASIDVTLRIRDIVGT